MSEKTHNPEVNPVEYKDFFAIMDEMNKVFNGISGQSRLKLYYNSIRDLPVEAVKDIAIKFMSSSRQTPLPSDFREAAREWLRSKKVYVHDEIGVAIECKYCDDTGINYLVENDTNKFYALIKCDCKSQIYQDLRAPTWKRELAASFIRKPMPIEWSKPSSTVKFDLANLELSALISKMKSEKKKSEAFWKLAGFEG